MKDDEVVIRISEEMIFDALEEVAEYVNLEEESVSDDKDQAMALQMARIVALRVAWLDAIESFPGDSSTLETAAQRFFAHRDCDADGCAKKPDGYLN